MFIFIKHGVAITLALILSLASVVTVNADAATPVRMDCTASAAVLYEPSSGRVLFEHNAHATLPMASTTKLMTALIACERLPEDAVLTATSEALAVEGSSMGLCVGDTISRHDALCGLLLSSGNDAANVIALSTAGSFEAFAAMMNERAVLLGMHDSKFVTPSGLDAEGHGASAYDMALLAAAVLQNEELASICAMSSATVTVGNRTVSLRNHNKLLSLYDGTIGMKTGYTSRAGRCLVSAARRNGVTLIAVTLHCPDDWQQHMTMLDEGFALMETLTLPMPPLAEVTVFGGGVSTVSLRVVPPTITMLGADVTSVEPCVVMSPYVWAPLNPGDIVGVVEYRLRGAVVARADIIATCPVMPQPPLSFWQRVIELFEKLLCHAFT